MVRPCFQPRQQVTLARNQNFCSRPVDPRFFLSWEAASITGRRSASTPAGLGNDPPTLPVRYARPARTKASRVDVTLLCRWETSSLPCVASRPCGVCIVAGCSFCVGEERECRASPNFYPRPLRPGFFLSCEKLAWRHRGPKEAPARGNRAAAQLSPATLLAEARRTTTADIVGAPAWWSPTMSRPGATG